MKRMKKARFWLSIILVMVMVLGDFRGMGSNATLVAEAAVATSGKCGDNATWKYSNGILTISGNGCIEEATWEGISDDIENVVISEGITEIETVGLLKNVKKISIPSTVKKIGGEVCKTIVEYSNAVPYFTYASEREFYVSNDNEYFCSIDGSLYDKSCNTLLAYSRQKKEFKISDKVKKIDVEAVVGCDKIKKIVIPYGVECIEYGAFNECTSLENIVIPNSVTSMDGSIFIGCEKLKHVSIPKSVKDLQFFCLYRTGIESISLSKNVKSLSFDSWMYYDGGHKTDIYYDGNEGEIKLYDYECINNVYYNQKNSEQYCKADKVVHDITKKVFTVRDIETGQPVTGFYWWTDNNRTKQYCDDVTGSFEINTMSLLPPIYIEKNGYDKKIMLDVDKDTSKVTPIYMGKKKNISVDACYAWTKEASGKLTKKRDVINGQKKSVYYDNDVTLYLDVSATALNTGKSVSTIEIAQSKYSNPSSSEVIKKVKYGTQIELNVLKLKKDYNIYYRLTDSDGNKTSWYKTNIGVYDAPGFYAGSMTFGKDLKVTLPKDVPIFGGTDIEMECFEELPITVVQDGDKIQIGVNFLESHNSGDIGKTKSELDNLKWYLDEIKNDKNAVNKSSIKNYLKQREVKEMDRSFRMSSAKLSVDLFGYFEGDVVNKKEREVSGELVLVVKTKNKDEIQYTFMGVPMVLSLEFNGKFEGSVKGSLTWPGNQEFKDALKSNSLVTKLVGKIKAEIELAIGTGPGFAKLANFNVVASGKVDYTNTFLEIGSSESSKGTVVDLTIKGSVRVSILSWTAEKVFAQKKWNIYDSTETVFNDTINYMDETFYVLDKRTNSSNMVLTKSNRRILNSRGESIDLESLCPNVCDDSKIIVKETADKQFVFYTVDDAGRADVDRYKLAYNIQDKVTGEWTGTKAVWDDGTADFNPYIYVNGNDIYATWVNMNKVFGSAVEGMSMEDSATASEVVVAKFDNSTGEFVTLFTTENEVYDCQPTISESSEGITLTWVRNDNSNIFCNDNSNKIISITCKDGNVSDEDILADGVSNVIDHESGSVAGADVCIYVTDIDGDYATTDDHILSCIDLDDKSTRTLVEKGDVFDIQFANIDGENLILWYQNQTIMKLNNINVSAEYLIGENAKCIEDFKVNDSPSKVFVTFIQEDIDENGARSVVSGYIYDKATAAWSEKTEILNNNTFIREFSPMINENGELEIYYTETPIVPIGEETPIVSMGSYTMDEYSNLNLTCVAYDDYESSDNGNVLDATVQIFNQGTKAANNIVLKLYDDGGAEVDSQNIDITVVPGETKDIDHVFKIPDSVGVGEKFTVKVFDLDNTEQSDSNSFDINIGYANLDIEDVQEYRVEEMNSVSLAVMNNGLYSTGGNLVVREGGIEGPIVQEFAIDTLAPGEGEIIFINIDTANTDWGEDAAEYYFDLTSEIEEKDLINNNYSFVAVRDTVEESPLKGVDITSDLEDFETEDNVSLTATPIMDEEFEAEKLSYRWYEEGNEEVILSETDKLVVEKLSYGDHVFVCEINCNDYVVSSTYFVVSQCKHRQGSFSEEDGTCSQCGEEIDGFVVSEYLSLIQEQNYSEGNWSNPSYNALVKTCEEAEEIVVSGSAIELAVIYNKLKMCVDSMKEATIFVELSSEPAEFGELSGAGKYAVGEDISLKANTVNDYYFAGWYLGEKKLSDELECSVKATNSMNGNINIVAKYKHDNHNWNELGVCTDCELQGYKVTFAYDNSSQEDEIWSDGRIDFPEGDYTFKYNGNVINVNEFEVTGDIVINVVAHKFTHYISDNNAKCMEDGTKTAYCDNGCDVKDTVVDVGSRLGHVAIESKTVATITENGSIVYTCERCGEPAKDTKIIYCPSEYKLSASSYNYTATVHKPNLTITDSNGEIISDENYSIAYEDEAGNAAKSIDAGTYIARVTFRGDYSGENKVSYAIKPRTDSKASLAYTSVAYSGLLRTPSVTVKNNKGKVLVLGQDYTVKYTNNKKVGKATVKITMKGNYSGTITKTFKIVPKKTTIGVPVTMADGIRVNWAKNTTGTGYRIYRSINGGKFTLVKTIKTNTTVSWKDTTANVNGNRYQYKIVTYKNVDGVNYLSKESAVKTKYFVKQPAISSVVNVTGLKLTVKWTKNAKANGYQIQYSDTSDFSRYTSVNIDGASTVAKTISKLKKGKKYYVRIRSYKTVGGTKYYSAWSSKKSVTISN